LDNPLRADLDAYYARLYGLTRDELHYTPSASIRKKAMAKTLRHALSGSQGRFPWRNVPCAEGEGNQAVWRSGMGWGKDEGGMMKDERKPVCVLREKETKQFSEYQTRRLVLDAWDGERMKAEG
jgi:hypothetical protein